MQLRTLAPLGVLAASASAQDWYVQRFSRAGAAVDTAAAAAALGPAEHVLPFTGKAARSQARRGLRSTLRQRVSKKNYTDTLAGADYDEEYLTDITIGGQSFKAIVDTGSSDTWLVKKGFQCTNLTSYPEPESECAFGPTFDPSKSKTFKAYPDHNFNIEYGDGEYLTGSVGFDTVTVAGLSVAQQEIGVVDAAAWNGDGVNSGLLGLAYPYLTSVYNGTDPAADGSANFAEYSPWLFSAIAQGRLAQPVLSVALNRGSFAAQENATYDPHLGYLGLGGVAPVPTAGASVTVPVQGYTLSSTNKTEYLWYTVDVGAYVFPNSTKVVSKSSAILDSGTTLNYVPTAVAAAYNAAFHPPATYVEDEDTYYVSCNAKVPPFSVTIGGKSFAVDGRDNILPVGTDDDGNEVCISGTQDGGAIEDGNIFILGDVFLHNVVATFNLGANTIHLSERAPY